ncbi:MAG: autotransporter assembly complex family protein [Candidatus Binatia bacterium]
MTRDAMRVRGLAALALLVLVPLAGCSAISRTLAPLGLTTPEGYAYEVEIVGVGGQLADRLEAASVLFENQHEPPSNRQGLRRRAQSDRDIFLRVLRSRAYYEGTVTWEIDSSKRPAIVQMKVTRGNRYMLTRMDITGLPEKATDLATETGLATLGVVPGAPALAETVIGAENRLLVTLASRGYPYAVLAPREARIDPRTRTMEVVLRVDAGPHTRFGDVFVDGDTQVEEDFIRKRVTFERGEAFSPEKVEESRKALFASGVFSAVSLDIGKREDVGPDGLAPIRVVVAEGDMRSVGAGVKYSTVDGIGGRVFWEHRNVTGIADRFRIEVDASENLSTGGVSYRRPDWYSRGQNLLLDAKADADSPPAYDRFAVTISAGIERPIWKNLVVTAGLAIEQDEVNSKAESDGTKSFTLVSVPLGLRYDGSDNLFDPSRGHRTLVGLTPFVSVYGESVQMLVARLTESFYVPITSSRRQIWATRFSLGSVIGPKRNDVPADKRLYAGGGDSVRGYEFQFVGPLRDVPEDEKKCPPEDEPDCSANNADFRPRGGRSLLQVGTEVRWKIGENFGLVPFVEGAGVYEASYPDFHEDFLWAAGLGLRYFTVAGPIRFDVGFPLNPRQPDDIFQIYISLGQAF